MMNGISISRSTWVVRPGSAIVGCDSGPTVVVEDGLSDFSRFLSPLKERMLGRHWILQGDVFCFPDSWYEDYDEALDAYTSENLRRIEALVLEEEGLEPWRLVEGEYLHAATDNLRDDWCDAFRLTQEVPGVKWFRESFWESVASRILAEFISEWVDIVVAAIDGLRWDVFSPDMELLNELEAHVLGMKHINVRRHSINDFIAMFYYPHDKPANRTVE